MELKHDWKALNQLLFSNDYLKKNINSTFFLEKNGTFIDGGNSNGSAFQGTNQNESELNSLLTLNQSEKSYLIQEKNLNQWVQDATHSGSNFYAQICYLQDQIRNEKKTDLIFSRNHFFLELFTKKWARFFPKKFNVLLFVDERSSVGQFSGFYYNSPHSADEACKYKAILLSFLDGKLDQFFEPDFSSLHDARLKDWVNHQEEICNYLENRYLLDCFTFFMFKDVWQRMLGEEENKAQSPVNDVKNAQSYQSVSPWRLFTRYTDSGRAAIYPKPYFLKAFLATQRVMLYLARA